MVVHEFLHLLLHHFHHKSNLKNHSKKSKGRIIGARLGPMYVYLISGAKNIQTIFRNSKIMTSDFLVLEVYRKVMNVPKHDLAIFEADTSGSSATPLTPIPDEKRIWRRMHEILHRNMAIGPPLDTLTSVFTTELHRVLDEQPLDEWTTVDVYKFVSSKMSTASTISLIGNGMFKHNPQITDDFWEYFDGFMALFMELPRFMNPGVWEARERLNRGCVRHLRGVEERYDQIQQRDEDWDEEFGSRMNRLRDKLLRDSGVSIEGRGAQLGGFLIGYILLFSSITSYD